MASAWPKMTAAGSFAFEIGFSLQVLMDGRTRDIQVTYLGDFRYEGYSSAAVTVTAPDESIDSRIITFDHTTHVLDTSTQRWEVTSEGSSYFVDLTALFGGRADDLLSLSPNPPKDTDGRREESGRGVRELQGK